MDAQQGSLHVVEFEQLDTSFAISPDDEERERRRLMTLLTTPSRVQTDHRLAQSEVVRAFNTEGETFALKRLCPLPADMDPASRRGREAALFEEYRNLVAVSHLQGFPRAYGYGVTRGGEPAILMEWVEGITLHDALEQRLLPKAPDDTAGTDGVAVASLAISVLRALVSTTYLEGTFAHRDISPRNIMLHQSGDVPASWGVKDPLECCLVDLGSAVFMRRDEATFTMTTDVWRNATPEYAPPEMLALSDRSYLEARRSPAIDVYALCSVLYEVYCGHTPYQLADHQGESAFDLKIAGLPPVPALHNARDKGLVEAIMSGLAPTQSDRPSASELFDRLAAWRKAVTGQTASKPGPKRHRFARGVSHLTLSKVPESIAVPQSLDSVQGDAVTTDEEESVRGRSLSRRGLIVGAACITAAAGGIYWWERSAHADKAQQFAGMSWEDLADLADRLSAAGTRDEALSLAVEAGIARQNGSMANNLHHKVTLGDGSEATVQVVDFCHDDRADGQGKAGLTFAFTKPVAERPMADQTMASGGWEQCSLRTWLDNDFRDLLPDELADRIVPVLKMTNNAGSTRDASSVTATEDGIWLFSMKELGGAFLQSNFNADYQYLEPILNAEGEQYRLWQDKRAVAKGDTSCLHRSWKGQPCLWWNRSPSPDCSEDNGETWFNRVGTSGDVFHFACAATGDDQTSTVLPGFCL